MSSRPLFLISQVPEGLHNGTYLESPGTLLMILTSKSYGLVEQIMLQEPTILSCWPPALGMYSHVRLLNIDILMYSTRRPKMGKSNKKLQNKKLQKNAKIRYRAKFLSLLYWFLVAKLSAKISILNHDHVLYAKLQTSSDICCKFSDF